MKIYDYHGKKNVSGDRIREARLKRRLTQEDLAAKLQIEGVIMERDSVSRMEIGTRFVTDYELMVLSKVLGVSTQWLVGLEE
ncbi:XRE family transcriptional regulator [Neglecta sp. X4]|uniref:helix-turn-helix domain-containing protein n=1 Tax=unclassified Neglectibacter TaxID=2632164 RepID=UPI001367D8E5|nr:XRE family transcriptional regulator [Neglectibacter sp. 59]NBJ73085.1 XRE family transcriptional regulator [Neglectibacter sp. X4]NCE80971.1 XRE family transcriptional regulator [Neglectibacter sp. X58]